jgi:hypothetical protein
MPSFSDVPQADLLAKAFMTFLYSIGSVFRDPAFQPLLQSLDQHFEGKSQDPRESSESAPSPSPSVSPPQPGKSERAHLQEVDSSADEMEKELLK